MQYLLFYAEIIDKNRKNRAYADLGHINGEISEETSEDVERPLTLLYIASISDSRPVPKHCLVSYDSYL